LGIKPTEIEPASKMKTTMVPMPLEEDNFIIENILAKFIIK
jgi:hypothetical protein